MMKILLSGGGTAGHITPLLAVAQELLAIEPNVEISFIGQKGDRNAAVLTNKDFIVKTHLIHAGKFRRFHSLSLWQNITNVKVNLLNLRDVFYILLGCFEALYILLRHRPDAILFKGGFVVVPIGMAARLLRIRYVTHDSDPLPGLANRLIAGGAMYNAVVNDTVTTYPKEKTIVAGVPLAAEYVSLRGADQKDYKTLLGLPANSIVLFVFTGTQGAKIIDNALEAVLPSLLNRYPDLYVNYVFGRLNEASAESRYKNLSKNAASRMRKMLFIDNAYNHIAAADIVIGRAGATSMAEFATIGRPTIVIPAEQLTGGHQLMNAELYAQHSAVRIVREAELSSMLEPAIVELIEHPDMRKKLTSAIQSLVPADSAKVLAKCLCEVATQKVRHK